MKTETAIIIIILLLLFAFICGLLIGLGMQQRDCSVELQYLNGVPYCLGK